MSEIQYEVWWSGKKEWAEPCERIEPEHLNHVWIVPKTRGKATEVPSEWLHPVEPEIAPGTLVYAWDGKRPVNPPIGKYEGFDGKKHMVQVTHCDQTHGTYDYHHVEPIAQQPEIELSQLERHALDRLKFIRQTEDSDPYLDEISERVWVLVDLVDRIIPRP